MLKLLKVFESKDCNNLSLYDFYITKSNVILAIISFKLDF
jgi:hypothetical protein